MNDNDLIILIICSNSVIFERPKSAKQLLELNKRNFENCVVLAGISSWILEFYFE